MSEDVSKVYFAEANFRNRLTRFGIKREDRRKHVYVVGKTGMGKTTMLENMAAQDILNGEGVGIVDPHGEFAKKMLDFIPEERIKDVIYFDPSVLSHPIGFNILESVDSDKRHLVASGLMGVFKKIWVDVWSARMEYILGNAILALLEYPGATLMGINRMLSNKEFRKEVLEHVKDPVVKSFWVDEFAKYTDRYAQESIPAIQNKVGQFISNPLIRNIIGQKKSAFDIRQIMDEKKILIMNLSKGNIGEENARLIGAMLITKLYLGAMSRTDVFGDDFPDFYLYVDEFQNFASESFANILSEARKYRLNLILAHQYIAQMDEEVSDAVFGNVGTMITFRVGAADAELFEKEFFPDFFVKDICSLGFKNIYLKLMIDGVASRPFSAQTLPPIVTPTISYRKEIVETSIKTYGTPRQEIEDMIMKMHTETAEPIKTERRGDGAATGISAAARPDLFEGVCETCGKRTFVPFEPDGRRPIYCKTHRPQPNQNQSQPSSAGPQSSLTRHQPSSIRPQPNSVREPIREESKLEEPRFGPRQEERMPARPVPRISEGQAAFTRNRAEFDRDRVQLERGERSEQKTISLKDLERRPQPSWRDERPKKPSQIEELRKALRESLAEDGEPNRSTSDVGNATSDVARRSRESSDVEERSDGKTQRQSKLDAGQASDVKENGGTIESRPKSGILKPGDRIRFGN